MDRFPFLLELSRDEAALVADELRYKLPEVAERAQRLSELREPIDRQERYGYCLSPEDE